ncbi:30S ribosomal protein S6e [Nanoarchaeota archaeon]
MATFKIVIGTKEGKCLQKEIQEPQSSIFLGKRIGQKVEGKDIGLEGYEFEITGGSDNCGFPMRKEIPGTLRKKIFAIKGVGLRRKGKGIRVRKTVCGNTIHEKTVQINLKILKEGKQKLFEKEVKKEESKKEAPEVKKEEPKKEVPVKKEEPKKEVKKEEPKKEVKKEEPKKEAPKQ